MQAVLIPQRDDNVKLLENAVLLHLHRHLHPLDKITYYSGNKECDFVVQQEQQVKALYQVCWEMQETTTWQREMDGIIEASTMTKCDNLFIITHHDEEVIQQNGKTVKVIPAWKWMLE